MLRVCPLLIRKWLSLYRTKQDRLLQVRGKTDFIVKYQSFIL